MLTIRVLVVEDNEADLVWIRRALARSRYGPIRAIEAEFAGSLEQATHRLQTGMFDAVLLDLGLPDSRDFSTVVHIRSRFPELPVVILSGLDDDATALAAIRDGAQTFVVKDFEAYRRVVRELICAVERNKRLVSLSLNRCWDEQTHFLAEPAFRVLADMFLSSIDMSSMQPRMFLVELPPDRRSLDDAEYVRWVDHYAEALRRTFDEKDVFARMNDGALGVFIKDGRSVDGRQLMDRFQSASLSVDGSAGSGTTSCLARLLGFGTADSRNLVHLERSSLNPELSEA